MDIQVGIRLVQQGDDLRVVASAVHASGVGADSEPHSSEGAACAQALSRLSARLDTEAAPA